MILVTGATGFVAQALIRHLVNIADLRVRACSRSAFKPTTNTVEYMPIDNISDETDWCKALEGVDTIIHAAARVHVMVDISVDPLSDFRKVNTAGTLNLARQAAKAGVRRFIFLSSIKVNGEKTSLGEAFTEKDMNSPDDYYALSKLEAEQGLLSLAKDTPMEVVIIRPPLVYGSGVKANFATMMKWIDKGVPLPLGAIQNKRSLIALDNLVDLIVTCIDHPAAANQVFLAADGEDLSTIELIQKIGKAMGKPTRLIPVPVGLLKLAASMLGKKEIAQRL